MIKWTAPISETNVIISDEELHGSHGDSFPSFYIERFPFANCRPWQTLDEILADYPEAS